MNEINNSLPQLLSMLQTAESNMKNVGPKPILMVRKDKGKGKLNAKAKPKDNGKAKPNKGNTALKPKGGIAKEGKYFHCGKTIHWKRNYPAYLKEVKKSKESGASTSGSYVIDINLSASNSWALDTDCFSHICTSIRGLQRSRNLTKGDVDM
ncbi:uncharacterized protein [Gossypium hirsutum]|uniref:Gag/pol protein n=1 Tax=Gossypium hirsutum TaxID=3635 RepID=A0A1U8IEC0_GOSHI|nr:uncharacterized protein LOC107895835 [Gossypium hirsutum]